MTSKARHEFTAAQVTDLLAEVDRRLKRRGVSAAVFIVGGAAIAATHIRGERLTADIDALSDDPVLLDEVTAIAAERGIPANWLNLSARPWMPALPPGVLSRPEQPGLGRPSLLSRGLALGERLPEESCGGLGQVPQLPLDVVASDDEAKRFSVAVVAADVRLELLRGGALHTQPGGKRGQVISVLRSLSNEFRGEQETVVRVRDARPFVSLGFCVWRWTLSLDELSAAARSHPLMSAAGARTRVHERMAWTGSREQLVKEQLLRVLSDVFGFEPQQLCVELPDDEDDWDEPEDDVVAASAS